MRPETATAASPATLSAVLIGAGAMAKKHIAAISKVPDIRIVGIYDPRKTSLLSLDQSIEHLHTSNLDGFEAMVRQSQLAIVACDTQHHREMAERSIRQGLHCLIEKPATGKKTDCAEILRLSRTHGARVAVGYIERFNPALAASSGYIASLPSLQTVKFCRMNPASGRHKGRSLICDLMIHDIDIAINLLGLKPASPPTFITRLSDREDPDYVVIGYTSNNDVRVELCASRLPGARVREIHLYGSNVDIHVDLLRRKFSFTPTDGVGCQISGGSGMDALQGQLMAFLQFCRCDTRTRLATLDDAIETLDFCQSIR